MLITALVSRLTGAIRHINDTSGYGEIKVIVERGIVKRISVTTTENYVEPDSDMPLNELLALLREGRSS